MSPGDIAAVGEASVAGQVASSPPAPTIKIYNKDGSKQLHDLTPDEPVVIAVIPAKGADISKTEIEVTVLTDKGSPVTVTLHRSEIDAKGRASYWSGPLQFGRGFGEKYYHSGDKPELVNLESSNGGGGLVQYGGGAAGFTWYPNDLQQAIGVNERFVQLVHNFLITLQVELKDVTGPGADEVKKHIADKLVMVKAILEALANAKEWPRAQLNISQVGVGWLQRQGPLDLRAFYDDMRNAREQGEREGKSETWKGMGEFVIAGYAALANATGAASMWTLLFGQDIFGNDVGWKDRVFAGIDVAFQVAMLVVGIKVSGMWRVPRTTTKVSRTEYRRPVKGTNPTKAPEGAHVTAEEFGMLKQAQRHVQFVCDSEGVVIQVRPTNPEAMKWRAQGHPGKPMAIKAKTINELDVHLGAKPENVGLVGYFEPEKPVRSPELNDAQWAKVQERYVQRSEEFHDYSKKMAHLEHEGVIKVQDGVVIDTGICGGEGTGLGITGDHDLWRITDLNGNALPPTKLEQVVSKLKNGPYGAQHGAHTDWKIEKSSPTYATDTKVDTKIRKEHTMAAEGGDGVGVITFKGRVGVPQVGYEGGINAAKLWKPTKIGKPGRPNRSTAVRAGTGAAVAGAGVLAGHGPQTGAQGGPGSGALSPVTGQPISSSTTDFDPTTDVEGSDLASDTPSAANPVGPDADDVIDGMIKGFAGMGGGKVEHLPDPPPPVRRRTVETDMADAWDAASTPAPTTPVQAGSPVLRLAPVIEQLSTAARAIISAVLILAGLGLGAIAAPKSDAAAAGGAVAPAAGPIKSQAAGGGGAPTPPPGGTRNDPAAAITLTVQPIVATFSRPVTTYTVRATSSSGDTLTYTWSKTPERVCGSFNGGGALALWSHPDPPCPNEDVHPGTISVVIVDEHGHSATALYPAGSAAGTGPSVAAATNAPPPAAANAVVQNTTSTTVADGARGGGNGLAGGIGLVMAMAGAAVMVAVRKKHCDCAEETRAFESAKATRDAARSSRDQAKRDVEKADKGLYSATDDLKQATASLASAEQGLAAAQKYVADLQSYIDQAGHMLGPSMMAGSLSDKPKPGWHRVGDTGLYAKDGETLAAVANAIEMAKTTLIATQQGVGIADQRALLQMALAKAKGDLPAAQQQIPGAQQNVAFNKQNVATATSAVADAKKAVAATKGALKNAEKALATAESALDAAARSLTACQNRPSGAPCARHG